MSSVQSKNVKSNTDTQRSGIYCDAFVNYLCSSDDFRDLTEIDVYVTAINRTRNVSVYFEDLDCEELIMEDYQVYDDYFSYGYDELEQDYYDYLADRFYCKYFWYLDGT